MSKIRNIIHGIFKANFRRKIIKKQIEQLLEKNELLLEQYRLLKEQNRFILYQLQCINEMMRYQLLGDPTIAHR
jgi:hypothetical protein